MGPFRKKTFKMPVKAGALINLLVIFARLDLLPAASSRPEESTLRTG